MKILKDVFNDDEYGSDSYPIKELFGGFILEVETKQITRSLVGDINIGGNPSAEEGGDEGADDANSTITINNLVDAHKLQVTSYDKKSYTGHIKAYLKRLGEVVANNGKDVKAFQASAQEFVKTILGKFDDYEFYTGENMDPEAMVLIKFYKEDGIIPYFYIWKDGAKEVKY